MHWILAVQPVEMCTQCAQCIVRRFANSSPSLIQHSLVQQMWQAGLKRRDCSERSTLKCYCFCMWTCCHCYSCMFYNVTIMSCIVQYLCRFAQCRALYLYMYFLHNVCCPQELIHGICFSCQMPLWVWMLYYVLCLGRLTRMTPSASSTQPTVRLCSMSVLFASSMCVWGNIYIRSTVYRESFAE